MTAPPRVSIVICTDGRRASLAATLASLRQLDWREFEVCVVYGPTPDGTEDLLAAWPEPIKRACNPHRNLSVSRNLGILMAAGDIVAFLDDDSIPEPEWLGQIVAAYDDARVGAAGGLVHDHTGVAFQYRFGTADRMGRSNLTWERATPEFNFPYSRNFPHLLGANSSFRRAALIDAGGFDEEYDYYLDETDVTCRVVDRGWRVAQIDGAYVHHKFASSSLRSQERVLRAWYAVFKNKIYYSLVNRGGHHGVNDAMADAAAFVEEQRRIMEWAVSAGHLGPGDRDRFYADVARAWSDGVTRGLAGRRRLMPSALASIPPPPFARHVTGARPADAVTLCLLTQDYPPAAIAGVSRYIHQLARGIADLGHQVHVLTRGHGHDRVDLEDGVWVHRIVPKESTPAYTTDGRPIPQGIWNYAATMRDEVDRIAQRRDVACVYAPVWDCEGAALLRAGRVPLVIGLQTMFRSWLDSHPHRAKDEAFAADFIAPMLSLEMELLRDAASLHSLSEGLLTEIASTYGIDVRARARVIPLGLDDFAAMPAKPPVQAAVAGPRLLFVGRLEARKGIDILLEAIPDLLERFPHAHLDLVGNDRLPDAQGRTFRDAFEARALPDEIARRVVFHGEVSEPRLRGFYRACDIFVAPSRFESFGLILVEAMMFAKPVVACRAGGMTDIVAEGETGLLAEPGDVASLRDCLARLIADVDLRRAFGAAGRRRYEALFTTRRMCEEVLALMLDTARRARAAEAAPSAIEAAA